jgi:hypothetical protein
MVEIIGLVVISALVWVLAWAMGAENSDAEHHKGLMIPRQRVNRIRATAKLIRHAA